MRSISLCLSLSISVTEMNIFVVCQIKCKTQTSQLCVDLYFVIRSQNCHIKFNSIFRNRFSINNDLHEIRMTNSEMMMRAFHFHSLTIHIPAAIVITTSYFIFKVKLKWAPFLNKWMNKEKTKPIKCGSSNSPIQKDWAANNDGNAFPSRNSTFVGSVSSEW